MDEWADSDVIETVTVADLCVFDRVIVGHVVWTMDCISGRRLVMHRLMYDGEYKQLTTHYGPDKEVVRIVEPWNQKEECHAVPLQALHV